MNSPRLRLEDHVFGVAAVDGATAAAGARGDLETAAVLSNYYALVARTVAPADGRIVKVMGDGVLVVFPAERARDAVAALRAVQASGTALWSAFDVRCRVQVRVGRGQVASGPLGPPGDERFDIYGAALNRLFKLPAGEFVIAPDSVGRARVGAVCLT